MLTVEIFNQAGDARQELENGRAILCRSGLRHQWWALLLWWWHSGCALHCRVRLAGLLLLGMRGKLRELLELLVLLHVRRRLLLILRLLGVLRELRELCKHLVVHLLGRELARLPRGKLAGVLLLLHARPCTAWTHLPLPSRMGDPSSHSSTREGHVPEGETVKWRETQALSGKSGLDSLKFRLHISRQARNILRPAKKK